MAGVRLPGVFNVLTQPPHLLLHLCGVDVIKQGKSSKGSKHARGANKALVCMCA